MVRERAHAHKTLQHGVLSLWSNQRMREFGLRSALGARPGDILRLVLGCGLRRCDALVS